MDSHDLAQLLALLNRGSITVPEAANKLLMGLMEGAVPDAALPAFVSDLPAPIGERLRELLGEIRRAGYRWKPFWLGPGGSVLASDADDAARLAQLCEVLEILG